MKSKASKTFRESMQALSLSPQDWAVLKTIKRLKEIRDHNLSCHLDEVISSVEIRESEEALAILEYEDPKRFREISALCS